MRNSHVQPSQLFLSGRIAKATLWILFNSCTFFRLLDGTDRLSQFPCQLYDHSILFLKLLGHVLADLLGT